MKIIKELSNINIYLKRVWSKAKKSNKRLDFHKAQTDTAITWVTNDTGMKGYAYELLQYNL